MRSEDIASVFNRSGADYEASAADLIQVSAARLVERLNLSQSDDLIDLGCGAGAVIAFAAPLLSSGSAIGVDLAAEQLALARERFRRSRLSPRFLHQHAAHTDLPRRSADGVALNLVLPYADRPEQLLKEATRLTRPGGRVGATVFGQPFFGRPGTRLLGQLERRGVAWPEVELQYNLHEYAMLALLDSVDERRLDCVEVEEIEREFWWGSFEDWWSMLGWLGLLPTGRDHMLGSIAQALREDERVVDPDGQVRCLVKILLLTAVSVADERWE